MGVYMDKFLGYTININYDELDKLTRSILIYDDFDYIYNDKDYADFSLEEF